MEGIVVTVVGRVVAAVAVVAGSIVLGGSAQAAVVTRQAGASGQITSPTDGQVVTGSSVTVSAQTGLMQLKMGLYVEGPSTPSRRVAGGGANQTISGTFDAGNAPNGTFTVTLKGDITGARYAGSTFKLRRPPEPPGNVNARLEGTTKVEVTWSKGSEPDLQSYEVATSQSGVVGRLSADNACSGSTCKAVLAVPAKAAGRRVGITVKAFRGDGDGGSVGSGKSGAAYVTVPAPAASQPKKQTTRQQTNKQQTPKTDGRTRVDPLPTLPAKKHVKPTTVPTRKPTTTRRHTSALPELPETDEKGNLPNPDTADTGRQEPSGTNKTANDETEAAAIQAGGVRAQSDESPMGNIGQYGMYVTGGLLLLLLAAHAGAWARRRALAAGAGNGGGSVAASAGRAATSAGSGADQHNTDEVPRARTASRRPAVVLAVARARMPEPPQAHPLTPLPDPASGQGPGEQANEAEGQARETPQRALGRAATAPDPLLGSADSRAAEAQGTARVQGVRAADASVRAQTPGEAQGAYNARGWREAEPRVAQMPGGASGQVPVALPIHLSVQDLRAAQEARESVHHEARQEAAGKAGRDARQEPPRIALPSSAVTDVPEPATGPTVPPATPLEQRWDDYLPPSPRCMEDSGFWERPLPGAGDFWASDDEERAYAGRRPEKGDS
ncbi:hypothetical protein [Nonomuraea sp. NPDC005692]|uniref:hypothetical protein n=1 Tax=Nonomuraea sp. NPDC005692 TaxID=3157168 RepID=UPI0033E0C4C8